MNNITKLNTELDMAAELLNTMIESDIIISKLKKLVKKLRIVLGLMGIILVTLFGLLLTTPYYTIIMTLFVSLWVVGYLTTVNR